jgi:peptide/nickel transport system substrate-binding protein
MLIYPMNINAKDPVMRPILGDVRFRRALSMALNREEIKETMFLGMGRPAQLAPLPGSPWYEEKFAKAYADYDPNGAARLLDEMGLRWDAERKFRLTRDGKPFTLRIDYYDVSPTSAPGAELAKAYWEDIGVRTSVEHMDGSRFWQLRGANDVQVTVWWGDGASPAAQSFLSGFLMTRPWEQWYETNGQTGEEPPAWVKGLFDTRELMHASPDPETRRQAGCKIFEIFARHLWTLGAVADVPVPFIHSRKLGNLDVARQRGHYSVTVAEAAEQWFFKQ